MEKNDMRRILNKTVAIVLITGMLIGSLSGCGSKAADTDTGVNTSVADADSDKEEDAGTGASVENTGSEEIKTVTMAQTAPWRSLNNYIPNGNEVSHIPQNIMYLQYARTLTDGSVEPLLLESWEVSEDGMLYTVHLRQDLTWHDGEPITADDVEWTFKTFSKAEANGGACSVFADFAGTDDSGNETGPDSIGVTKVDEYTLTWEMKNPISPSTLFFNLRDKCCMPKHKLESIPLGELQTCDYWYTNPVGSGPFKLVSVVEGERIEYEKYEDFALGEPDFDRLILRVVAPANLLSGLMSGDIDILSASGSELPLTDYEMAKEQTNLTVEPIHTYGYNYIVLNNSSPYLSDSRVRRAINMAIDKERIVRELLNGMGTVACLPYTQNHPFFNEKLADQFDVYDPAAAKVLLEEAGWNPDTVIQFGSNPGSTFGENVGILIQQDLAAIGMKIEIVQHDVSTRMAMFTAGELDMGLMSSGGAVEPNEPYNLYNPDGAYCFANLTDDTYVNLFREGLTKLDTVERKQVYDELEEYIIQEMPYVYLCNQDVLFVYNSEKLDNINAVEMVGCYRPYWEWKVKY